MKKDKMVYGLGTNYNGQLGLLNEDCIELEEVETLYRKNIKTFYCSIDAKCNFALTEEKKEKKLYKDCDSLQVIS